MNTSGSNDPDERTRAMTTSNEIVALAQRIFGWEGLRRGQADAVGALVAGSDVLAVMPTGYGKSAVYQLAGHLLGGVTVVVSPLISLQVDQIAHIAEQRDSDGAVAVNSTQSRASNRHAWEAIASHEAEFLFLSPEQLARGEVIDQLRAVGVTLFVVDEAHCVSSWGYEFRPDYLRLGKVIAELGSPRVVALTATASEPVRREIVERLMLRDPRILVHGFDRPNLQLQVSRHESRKDKAQAIERQVASLPLPGLIYVATHAAADQLSARLRELGYRAAAYHGGQPAGARERTQDDFHAGALDLVVATSAFGMGIDKADIRFVVHADIPDSLDDYYQQVGRAGRDGDPALAALHFRPEDLALQNRFASRAPGPDAVNRAVEALGAQSAPRPVRDVAVHAALSPRSTGRVIASLAEAEAVVESEAGVELAPGVSMAEASGSVHRLADRHRLIALSRTAMMRGYAETLHCRRQFLLGYFGDELAAPCGNCDTCASGSAGAHPYVVASSDSSAVSFAAGAAVDHRVWGAGTVLSTESDRILVFFASVGYKAVSLEVVAEGGILSPHGTGAGEPSRNEEGPLETPLGDRSSREGP